MNRGVAAETEVDGVSERKQACLPEQYVERQGEYCGDAHLAQQRAAVEIMSFPRRPVLQGLGALLSTLAVAGRPGALRAETQGLRFGRYGSLEAAEVAGADEDSLLVHDAGVADPAYAFALSRLGSADFAHTPIGIFRDVERRTYDDAMSGQIDAARERQGDGDLAALLAGNDTWSVA